MATSRLDVERYLRIPRVQSLDVFADGRHAVVSVARPSRDGTKYVADLWRVETSGRRAPERLTLGDTSDGSPRALEDGSVLFLANRAAPVPDAPRHADDEPAGEDPTGQVWRLPPSGEPRPLTSRSGGVGAFAASRDGAVLVYRAATHRGANDERSDRKEERRRKEAKATGLVFDELPIRFWDRFVGPRHEHLYVARGDGSGARDLTPHATVGYDDLAFDVSRDGRFACAAERTKDEAGLFAENLRLFDLESGESRALTSGRDSFTQPRFSPDGRRVVAVFHENVPGKTGRQWLVVLPVSGRGEPRALAQDLDLWPEAPAWTPDGRAILFEADQRGHRPLFRIDATTGRTARLTREGTFSGAALAPDGGTAYAVRSRLDAPPEVFAVPLAGGRRAPRRVTRFTEDAMRGARLARAESFLSPGAGGREVHSWLVLPPGRRPPSGWPLVLWVHGGPLGAWEDAWHWRWNPQLFAARGQALLLVNPRISTGYGQDFIEQGHARWGAEPYEDLMGAVDAALERDDLDASRVAAMGGSFGGYMANWIAGHTDRFRCIVSHAGLWDLAGFHGTADFGPEWEREFGDPYREPELYERWSPHRFARRIRTPMLVVHGERDYRVSVAEALQLFTALQRLRVPSRLLYFPDENHWILRPPNVRTWHETIFSWLDRWLR